MLSTLTVEKASFTEKSVDCLYFSSFLGRSEYILVRYKDKSKIFRKKIRYEQPSIRNFTILSEINGKGFFKFKNNHKVCLIEFNDDNKIVIRVKPKLLKKLESGIFERNILDSKITHSLKQEKRAPEQSIDIAKRLENIYKMWKDGILTKYEFSVAKKKVLNY